MHSTKYSVASIDKRRSRRIQVNSLGNGRGESWPRVYHTLNIGPINIRLSHVTAVPIESNSPGYRGAAPSTLKLERSSFFFFSFFQIELWSIYLFEIVKTQDDRDVAFFFCQQTSILVSWSFPSVDCRTKLPVDIQLDIDFDRPVTTM